MHSDLLLMLMRIINQKLEYFNKHKKPSKYLNYLDKLCSVKSCPICHCDFYKIVAVVYTMVHHFMKPVSSIYANLRLHLVVLMVTAIKWCAVAVSSSSIGAILDFTNVFIL